MKPRECTTRAGSSAIVLMTRLHRRLGGISALNGCSSPCRSGLGLRSPLGPRDAIGLMQHLRCARELATKALRRAEAVEAALAAAEPSGDT
jgi:hypothetical protein